MTTRTDALSGVLEYHERTKHHPGRYARSAGRLDWESQPDPFRRYAEAPELTLSVVPLGEGPGLDAALDPSQAKPATLDEAMISRLFFDSLALSAWKKAGASRWALRVNPSSGNLHPTEVYLVAGAIPGLTAVPGVFHYCPELHGMEQLRSLTEKEHGALLGPLPARTLLVGLSTIPWRESWKYGERAYRYCQLDQGHALAAVGVSAALLGWRMHLLPGVTDADLAALLGINEQSGPEAECPDALFALVPNDERVQGSILRSFSLAGALVETLKGRPHGFEPARLSPRHHPWPVIDEVAEATRREAPASNSQGGGPGSASGNNGRQKRAEDQAPPPSRRAGENWMAVVPPLPRMVSDPPAREVIRRRRSAQNMDGKTSLLAPRFFRLLHALLPGGERQPHATLPWRGAVHLAFLVHRVDGLSPGLYLLLRDPGDQEPLFSALRKGYLLEPPRGAPLELPFFLLGEGDVRALARDLCCWQDIASDGVFAVAMLADLGGRLNAEGPWFYRALHWEAGALGQVLYLEAEAAGLRGTGMGCFLDDAIGRLLGLDESHWQCLYCFTVGGAVEDPRISTLPAYAHRRGGAEP